MEVMNVLCLEMEMLCLCLAPCLGSIAGALVVWGVGIPICLGLYYAFPTFTEWMQGSSLPGPIQ